MSVQLPAPIANYIAASNAHDPTAAAACFSSDAVVLDEGHERRGSADILKWKTGTTEKYRPTAKILDAAEADGRTIVKCQVSGEFPGSPVELKYAFVLDGEKIARLEIVP